MNNVLAVETSCDDTSVAIVRRDGFVKYNKVMNQDFIHQAYGGVVPELASRNHVHHLLPLIEDSLIQLHYKWDDINGFSVTNRPGLVGSLIVGLVTVKALSLLLNKPYVGVNHIEGHLMSPFLWDQQIGNPVDLQFPYLALIVSGSHTHLFEVRKAGYYVLIGKTLDDAAGEVLDKFARLLKLPYPSGAQVDKEAKTCLKMGKYIFPKVVLKKDSFNFSFSGLKTAAVNMVNNMSNREKDTPVLCADYQETVVDQLIDRLDRSVNRLKFQYVIIAGGVSANSRLRKKALSWACQKGVKLILPPLSYCTDNAAMVAQAGFRYLLKGEYSFQNLNCSPYSYPSDFVSAL